MYCCARQPAPADLARIEEVLKRRHGLSKVEFQVKLEPELLGGFVIHLQGTTYDKSVRGMLRGLRRSLKETGMSFERQTGRNRIHTERGNIPV